MRCRASPQKISFWGIYRMQLSAEENVLHQGVSRCRCGSRHPFLALTHQLCPDSRQTVPSACRHRSPVDRQGRRMRLHGQWSPQLPMGTASAVVLDCLPCKITSWLVKERPLAKRGEVIFVAPQQATPPRSGFVQLPEPLLFGLMSKNCSLGSCDSECVASLDS